MKEQKEPTCTFTWNHGEWPYITRCVLATGHEEHHADRHGRPHAASRMHRVDNWVNAVVAVLTEPDHRSACLHREKLHRLAMEWPTLAAALAALIAVRGVAVPDSLRRARDVIEREQS